MTNNENEMLKQFQAWFEKEFGFGKKEILLTDDERGKALLGAAWLAWQASRHALVIELPNPSIHQVYNDNSDFLHIDGESLMRSVRAAIESQGVKCK